MANNNPENRQQQAKKPSDVHNAKVKDELIIEESITKADIPDGGKSLEEALRGINVEGGPIKVKFSYAERIEHQRLALELEHDEESLKEEFELLCLELEHVSQLANLLIDTGDAYQYKVDSNRLRYLGQKIQDQVNKIQRAHEMTEAYLKNTGLERTFPIYSDEETEAAEADEKDEEN